MKTAVIAIAVCAAHWTAVFVWGFWGWVGFLALAACLATLANRGNKKAESEVEQ